MWGGEWKEWINEGCNGIEKRGYGGSEDIGNVIVEKYNNNVLRGMWKGSLLRRLGRDGGVCVVCGGGIYVGYKSRVFDGRGRGWGWENELEGKNGVDGVERVFRCEGRVGSEERFEDFFCLLGGGGFEGGGVR